MGLRTRDWATCGREPKAQPVAGAEEGSAGADRGPAERARGRCCGCVVGGASGSGNRTGLGLRAGAGDAAAASRALQEQILGGGPPPPRAPPRPRRAHAKGAGGGGVGAAACRAPQPQNLGSPPPRVPIPCACFSKHAAGPPACTPTPTRGGERAGQGLGGVSPWGRKARVLLPGPVQSPSFEAWLH